MEKLNVMQGPNDNKPVDSNVQRIIVDSSQAVELHKRILQKLKNLVNSDNVKLIYDIRYYQIIKTKVTDKLVFFLGLERVALIQDSWSFE